MKNVLMLLSLLTMTVFGSVVSNVFASNMVLQHDDARLYGYTTASATVTVAVSKPSDSSFTPEKLTATADAKGFWLVNIAKKTPTIKDFYQIDVSSSDGSTQTLKNVLFGHVFWCGGQSNMESIQVRHAEDGVQELEQCVDNRQDASNVIITEWRQHSGQHVTFAPVDANAGKYEIRVFGLCLEALADKFTVRMKTCLAAGTASQTWVWNSSTKQLKNLGTGTCLASHIEGWSFNRCNHTGHDLELVSCDKTPRYTQWNWDNTKRRLINTVNSHVFTVVKPLDNDGFKQFRIMRPKETVTSDSALKEFSEITTKWTQPTINTLAHFSAVCWFMGKEIARGVPDQPIGLIEAARSATSIEGWMSPEALAACTCTGDSAPNKLTYYDSLNDKLTATAKSTYYNSLINPMMHMGFAGASWYQGEANIGNSECYKCMLPAMITDMRSKLGSRFPFAFVQLTPRAASNFNTAKMRLAQMEALKLADVTMSSAVDQGDHDSPYNEEHPRRKKAIGIRLGRGLRHMVFGDDVPYLYPTPSDYVLSADGRTITVSFDKNTIGTGLFSEKCLCWAGNEYCNQGVPFEVKGGNSTWYKASYTLANINTVDVTSSALPSGEKITGVRYMYADWPLPAIYSSDSLPAVPFVHTL